MRRNAVEMKGMKEAAAGLEKISAPLREKISFRKDKCSIRARRKAFSQPGIAHSHCCYL